MDFAKNMKTCKVFVSKRRGRNSAYSSVNNSPTKIHASRKFVVSLPKTAFPYSIVASISSQSTLRGKMTPFISADDKKKFNRNATFVSFGSNGLQPENFTFYLHTRVTEFPDVKSQFKYHFKVYLNRGMITNPYTTIIHEFDFEPVKSHKYETTQKAIKENLQNADAIETVIHGI